MPTARAADLDPDLLRAFERFSFIAGVIVMLLAGLVILGWWNDVPSLKSGLPGLVSMNPLTAVAFMLGSVSLVIVTLPAAQAPVRIFGRGAALIVAAIGASKLGDYAFGWNCGFDELLFNAALQRDELIGLPNRMAPNTALNFVLSGIALVAVDHPVARRFHVVESLAFLTGVIALQAIIGYAYGTRELYRVASFIPMAFNTAVAFALLSAGIVCARPGRRFMAVLTGTGSGSIMARRFLPVSVGLLLLIGWLRVLGERHGLYGLEFGVAFFATVTVILLTFTIWWTAVSLNRTERARRRAEQQQLDLASTAIQSASEGIVIADRNERIVSVNPAFVAMTGYADTEFLGKNLRAYETPSVDEETDLARSAILRVIGHWQGEIWLRTKTDDPLPSLMTVRTVRDDSGDISHYLTIFKDLSQHKRDEARLEFLSNHDPLTNLANRKRLLQWLENALSRARFAEGVVRVLLINLDRFHKINDSLGNPAGDLMLQAVAQRLARGMRDREMVACLGGDQFALLLEGGGKTEAIAQRILDMFSEPFLIVGQLLRQSASIGIAFYPQDGTDPQTLLKNAEAALRESKAQGGNTYRYFSADMNEAALAHLLMRHDLHQAIEREEFFLVYQPRIALASGKITGVEALIRWQSPQRGLVSPAHFIPIAEESGLIVPIGEWVNGAAIKQIKAWSGAGISPARMAINLSAHQFRRKGLAEHLAALLEKYSVPASCIELEITESMAMDNPAKTKAILSGLKELGVSIAIDDFGTGHSSLAYLKRFPIDYLKIDQSFIAGVPDDPTDVGITRSIIALARSLDLAVIAEGVETEAQREFLLSEQCDEMQGYLFSKPRPAAELEALLRHSSLVQLA